MRKKTGKENPRILSDPEGESARNAVRLSGSGGLHALRFLKNCRSHKGTAGWKRAIIFLQLSYRTLPPQKTALRPVAFHFCLHDSIAPGNVQLRLRFPALLKSAPLRRACMEKTASDFKQGLRTANHSRLFHLIRMWYDNRKRRCNAADVHPESGSRIPLTPVRSSV